MRAKQTCVSIYVSSQGIETRVKELVDEVGAKQLKHFIYGSINGAPFEVPCDCMTEVSPDVALALSGLIEKQMGAA